jgi:hypothetical protein
MVKMLYHLTVIFKDDESLLCPSPSQTLKQNRITPLDNLKIQSMVKQTQSLMAIKVKVRTSC